MNKQQTAEPNAQQLVNRVYVTMQNFQFQPTEHNVAIAMQCMRDLKVLYTMVGKMMEDAIKMQPTTEEAAEVFESSADTETSVPKDSQN